MTIPERFFNYLDSMLPWMLMVVVILLGVMTIICIYGLIQTLRGKA